MVTTQEAVWSAPLFWDGELVVLVGPPLEQGCFGEGFHYPTATTVTTPGGDVITRSTDTDRVWVFDDEGLDDPIDWLIGRACSAVWAGEPAPEPLAHGEGTATTTSGSTPTVACTATSGFAGRVTTADGDRVHLSVVGAGLGEFPDAINHGG